MRPILPHCREMGAARDEGHVCPDLGERGAIGPAVNGMRPESQVRNRLVWGFFCQGAFPPWLGSRSADGSSGFADSSSFGAGKPFFVL